MKRSYILILLIFFSNIFGQKCENLIQNIDAKGNFNIFTIDENKYSNDLKDSVKILIPTKNNNKISLADFQKKFPKIYDGKCINIYDENNPDKKLKFCAKSKNNIRKENDHTLYGEFLIDSYLDEFYILRFSGFEISSNLIIDTKNRKLYIFGEEPRFSENKKFIFGYSSDYRGFALCIREIGYERGMRYTLDGKYDVNEVKLIKFRNFSNFELLLNLKETIRIRDDNYRIINTKTCNLNLGVN